MPEFDAQRGMRPLDFWSDDRSFGLHVGEAQLWNILWLCERSGIYETGGILAGHYTGAHDCAVVTAISGPTADSRSGRATFYRGTRGLQQWLDHLWRSQHHYYLGEWHYHPGASSEPSATDVWQMQAIGSAPHYNCPEPVLLIIGSNAARVWEAKAYVCPYHREVIELKREQDEG